MVLKPSSARVTWLFLITLLFLVETSYAQYRRRSTGSTKGSWEVSLTGGVSKFLTTVNPNADALYKKFNLWKADMNPAVSLSIARNFSPKFSAELAWMTTQLSGTWNENSGYPVHPLAIAKGLTYDPPFKTGINQFSLLLGANLNQIIAPNMNNDTWNIFVKGGMGYTHLKYYEGLYVYGPDKKKESSIIYGLGGNYKIQDNLKFQLGAYWHSVRTDRLDAVHNLKTGATTYHNEDHIFNCNEKYLYAYVGLSYSFGQAVSKAHFIQRNNRSFLWFKPSTRSYRRRR